MFSTKLSRAAHRATTHHTAAAAISATSSTACASSRPGHQRRPSSSKASCPPDNSAPKAAPAAKADGAEAQEAPVSQPAKSSKGRSRGGYRRVGQASSSNTASMKSAEPVDQFAGLPSVPNLQGMDAKGEISGTDKAYIRKTNRDTAQISSSPPSSPSTDQSP